MTRLLLERGATINTYDRRGRRAIHWAAFMCHIEVVNILIGHGADINCYDNMVCYHVEHSLVYMVKILVCDVSGRVSLNLC